MQLAQPVLTEYKDVKDCFCSCTLILLLCSDNPHFPWLLASTMTICALCACELQEGLRGSRSVESRELFETSLHSAILVVSSFTTALPCRQAKKRLTRDGGLNIIFLQPACSGHLVPQLAHFNNSLSIVVSCKVLLKRVQHFMMASKSVGTD